MTNNLAAGQGIKILSTILFIISCGTILVALGHAQDQAPTLLVETGLDLGTHPSLRSFSPDGRLFLVDTQKSIHLWNSLTGHELRRFERETELKEPRCAAINTGAARCVSFSPDSKWLIYVDGLSQEEPGKENLGEPGRRDSKITVRNIKTGAVAGQCKLPSGTEVAEVTATTDRVFALAIDARANAAASERKPGYATATVYSCAFADFKAIGLQLQGVDLILGRSPSLTYGSELFVSEDKAALVNLTEDKITVCSLPACADVLSFSAADLYDIKALRRDGMMLALSYGSYIDLLELKPGSIPRRISSGLAGGISSLEFARDGNSIFAFDGSLAVNRISVTDGSLVQQLPIGIDETSSDSYRASPIWTGLGPDGAPYVTIYGATLANLESGVRFYFGPYSDRTLRFGGYSPDLQKILVIGEFAFWWSTHAGSPQEWLFTLFANPFTNEPGRSTWGIASTGAVVSYFSTGSRLAYSGTGPVLYDASEHDLLFPIVERLRDSDGVSELWANAFNLDRIREAAVETQNGLNEKEVSKKFFAERPTRKEVMSLYGRTFGMDRLVLSKLGCGNGAISHSGAVMACPTGNGIVVKETAKGRTVGFAENLNGVALAFTPNDEQLLVLTDDDALVFDAAMNLVRHAPSPASTSQSPQARIVFGPHGRFFIVSFSTWGEAFDVEQISICDFEKMQNLATLDMPKRLVDFGISPDGNILFTSSEGDGKIRLWDLQATLTAHSRTLILLASIAQDTGEEDRWLVVTPDGLFDGSTDYMDHLSWRYNNDTFDVVPVEAFFKDFYRPGLLSELLKGERPRAPARIADLDRRQPTIQVKPLPPDQNRGRNPRTVPLVIRFAEARDAQRQDGTGVYDLRLFRNGSLVRSWHGAQPLDADGKGSLSVEVPIVAGKNRFTAYAFSRANVKSVDARWIVKGEESLKRPAIAYVVAIGINEYQATQTLIQARGRGMNLRFAEDDAKDFAETFRAYQNELIKNQAGQYAQVRLAYLPSAVATRANIMAALARLGGAPAEVFSPEQQRLLAELSPTQPEDGVFLFYSGHGTKVDERYYVLPNDFDSRADPGSDASHTISDKDFAASLEKIDAGRFLLVIDACHSGSVIENRDLATGLAPTNSRGLAQLAYDKGMDILVAAQGEETANEAPAIAGQSGHGFLTFALVEEGLKQKKAAKDGQIELRHWLEYAAFEVPPLQTAYMMAMKQKKNKDVGILDHDVSAKDPDPRTRTTQNPRAFFRREPDPVPFIVALP